MAEHIQQRKRYYIRRKKVGTVHEENENTAIIDNGALNEMAISRKHYFNLGLSQSKPVLAHIGKMCVLGNLERFKGEVSRWQDEIEAQVYDLGRINVDNDDKQCKIKKKAFVQSFIEGRLGRNFSEYDEKMHSYFIDGLEDEFKDEIENDKNFLGDYLRKNDINVKDIALKNKERIKTYLESFVPLLSIRDVNKLKEEAKKAAHKF